MLEKLRLVKEGVVDSSSAPVLLYPLQSFCKVSELVVEWALPICQLYVFVALFGLLSKYGTYELKPVYTRPFFCGGVLIPLLWDIH